MASSKPQGYYICLLKALRGTSSQSQSSVGAGSKVTKPILLCPGHNCFWGNRGYFPRLCTTYINNCNKGHFPSPLSGFFDIKTAKQREAGEWAKWHEEGGWIREQDTAWDYMSQMQNQIYRRCIWSMASIERQWISHYNHPVHYWLS